MNILGLSCYFHDAAAALLRDGELIAAAEDAHWVTRASSMIHAGRI